MYNTLMTEDAGEDRLEEIDVDVLEWQRGQGAQRLVARGAGPCTVAALRIGPDQIGYMAHYPDTLPHLPDFDEMLQQAATEGDPASMRVWLRGDSPFGYRGASPEEALLHRRIGRDRLIGLFVAAGVPRENIDVEWTDELGQALDAELECDTDIDPFKSNRYPLSSLGIGPDADIPE